MPNSRCFTAFLAGLQGVLLLLPGSLQAQHESVRPIYQPKVAAASNEGELAIRKFTVAPGLQVDLFAAEPDLANPVGFGFDEKGRCYVVETFRHSAGVPDIRGLMSWLDEDLACRSVNDRLNMMKRHLGDKLSLFTVESDRVKLLEDRDGDGRVDHSSVFADGFNTPLDGIGASVLARKGDVYFANIPNLWLLRDGNGDGWAEFRQSLHYGFGVRLGFIGHDLHGLRFGPDGRLYFSIGDRGSSIRTGDGRRVGEPDSGCVFRCNPDGSDLEVFAFGLRNPQGLAFDDYGNLFTGDNNSDSGDKARWVYVVEGGDSGWRIGYQFLERPYARGPFNAEKLWFPAFEDQAAYIIPPITNITDGPSGLSYYPGTGLPEAWRGHFFLVDFRGSANSGVHAFSLAPKGASFEVVNPQKFVWQMLATDCQFGVDGGLYVSDWVQGWNKTGKGRIYRVHDPLVSKSKEVTETRKLLVEGMDRRSVKELTLLLAHPDHRIRQEAQFALAGRRDTALKPLQTAARRNSSQLARVHAIWALTQIARAGRAEGASRVGTVMEPLLNLVDDSDPEIRAQVARAFGDCRFAGGYEGLIQLLHDTSPRVRFHAALATGRLGHREALPSLFTFLRENADRDPYLRHAGVMALAAINDIDSMLALARDESRPIRLGVLLALRRLERPEIAVFLKDPDESLVLEAARAINDLPINGAMLDLAALADRSTATSEPLLRRILNANFRCGTEDTARALAGFAAADSKIESMRAESLAALGDWPRASGRDRVTGLWRPTSFARNASTPADAVRGLLPEILLSAPNAVRLAAAKTAGKLGITEAAAALHQLLADTTLAPSVRVEALKTLSVLNDDRLEEAVNLAAEDSSELLRKEASRLQAALRPADASVVLARTLDTGTTGEKQAAFAALGSAPGDAPDQALAVWLDKLIAGDVPREIQLDLLEAAGKRAGADVKSKLEHYESLRPADDPMAGFREVLYGGNSDEGRRIFFERADVACLRCHKVRNEGGEVGPDLTQIGSQKDRTYLLESILLPNKDVAAGYESVLVSLKDGTMYAGVLKSETGDEFVINSPEDGLVTVKKADVQTRDKGLSGMPEGMDLILSKPDLRNLIEYLSSLK